MFLLLQLKALKLTPINFVCQNVKRKLLKKLFERKLKFDGHFAFVRVYMCLCVYACVFQLAV